MMDESTDKYAAPPKYDDTEGGAYSQSQTQTHTHTEHTTHTATLGLNKDYIRTIPGILKLVEVVTSLACFITTVASQRTRASGWFGFVAGTVFFISLVWFFIYLFNLIGKIHPVRILIEWIYYLVLAICFLIAAVVAAVYATAAKALGAYAFFGFICTAALFVDLFLQFKVWRTQGVTSHSQSTTVTTAVGGHTVATTDIRY